MHHIISDVCSQRCDDHTQLSFLVIFRGDMGEEVLLITHLRNFPDVFVTQASASVKPFSLCHNLTKHFTKSFYVFECFECNFRTFQSKNCLKIVMFAQRQSVQKSL